MARAVDDQLNQIQEDQKIDGEKTDANPGEPAEDFEDFPGQKRSSNGESKEFAPGFFEIESDAFSERDGGIGEGDEADAAQRRVVDEGSFFENEVDETRLRVEVKMIGEDAELIGHIFVEKATGADTDNDEEKGMEKFIGRDEEQPLVVVAARGMRFGGGGWHEGGNSSLYSRVNDEGGRSAD